MKTKPNSKKYLKLWIKIVMANLTIMSLSTGIPSTSMGIKRKVNKKQSP